MKFSILSPLLLNLIVLLIAAHCSKPVAGNGSQIGSPVATVVLNTDLQDVEYQTVQEKNSYALTSNTWTQFIIDSALSQRGNAPLTPFNNKLWIIGGNQWHFPALPGTVPSKTDVWCSTNGNSWAKVCDSAPWGPRQNYSTVEYQGKLWLLGGWYENNTGVNDVWSSTDGATWTIAASTVPWSQRGVGGFVAFNNKLWVIGNADPNYHYSSDVWSSSDGVVWDMVTDSAFPKRNYPGCVVFKNKIWIIGGCNSVSSQLFDVWNTADGLHWTQVGYSESWTPREGFGCLSFDNKMWIIGGSDYHPSTAGARYFGDVWFSINGVEWNDVTISSITDAQMYNKKEWPGRERLSCAVFNGSVYCGFGETVDGFLNDLWKFECK
jgi:hypothetical protein